MNGGGFRAGFGIPLPVLAADVVSQEGQTDKVTPMLMVDKPVSSAIPIAVEEAVVPKPPMIRPLQILASATRGMGGGMGGQES